MIRKFKAEKPTDTTNPELEDLQTKLAEAEAELVGFRSVQDITEVEIRELRKELAAAQAKALSASASDDFTALKELLAQKDKELASLRAASTSSPDFEGLRVRAGQSDYLFSQLEAARATISKLENEMLNQPPINQAAFEQAFLRVRELESELARAHEDFDRSEELRRKAEDDKALIQQELSHVQRQIEETQGNLAGFESLKADVEDLSIKLAGREQMVTELRKELSTVNARYVGAQTELEDLRTTRTTLEAENQNLRDDVANLKYEVGESKTLQERLAAAQIELESHEELKRAKHQLQDRLGNLEGELAAALASAQESEALRLRVLRLEDEASHAKELKEDLDYIRSLMSQALTRLNDAASEHSTDLPSFLAPLPKSAA